MSENLFGELTRIGIDQELAAKVSASLDPEYNASKKDILVMQEAIMQVQLRSDNRHYELNNKIDTSYHDLNNKIDASYHELNEKIDTRYHELNEKIDTSYHELNEKIDTRYHELNNKIDTSYHELNNKIDSRYHELDSKIDKGFAGIRTEMASMTRQYQITFGTLLCSILAVFLVNVWFHL